MRFNPAIVGPLVWWAIGLPLFLWAKRPKAVEVGRLMSLIGGLGLMYHGVFR